MGANALKTRCTRRAIDIKSQFSRVISIEEQTKAIKARKAFVKEEYLRGDLKPEDAWDKFSDGRQIINTFGLRVLVKEESEAIRPSTSAFADGECPEDIQRAIENFQGGLAKTDLWPLEDHIRKNMFLAGHLKGSDRA